MAKIPCAPSDSTSPRWSVTTKVRPWLMVIPGGATLISVGMTGSRCSAARNIHESAWMPLLPTGCVPAAISRDQLPILLHGIGLQDSVGARYQDMVVV